MWRFAMQRYTPLFLIAFVFSLVLLAGNTYLTGYADQTRTKTNKSITVYTTLPVEHVAVLAEAYEKTNHVKVNFIPLSEEELLSRIKKESAAPIGTTDLVLADKETLLQSAATHVFVPYESEQTDIISDKFKDQNGDWVGVWYDPIIFCANKDYLLTLPVIPNTWDALAALPNVRIGITDFFAADASANLLFTLIAEYDENKVFTLLNKLHPKVAQYSKYLSTPVRMAGMGEVDVSIAVQSETIRYMNEGFPLTIIYPTDGTAYKLTGAGILKNAPQKVVAEQFMKWLTEDDVQFVLQQNKFFFVPTNQSTVAYKLFSGKSLTLFDNYSDLTLQQKRAVLDRWVKNIRLK